MTLRERVEALRMSLVQAASRRIAWARGQGRVTLEGGPFAGLPIVVVLGREHYEETRKSYGIRSWRGLNAVVQLELAGQPRTLFVIGPRRGEGHDVSFFRLKPSAAAALEGAVFCIPESLAIERGLDEGGIARVDRDHLEYYLGPNVASQLKGGAIINERLFVLSAGLSEDAPVAQLSDTELPAILGRGLRRIAPLAWWGLFVARDRVLENVPWRRLATAAAVGLLGYMVLVSAYLELTTRWRQRQLAALGNDIGMLLEKQHLIERSARELEAMTTLARERPATHRLWGVVADVWRAEGSLNAVQLEGDKLVLRGGAPVATNVLAALSKSNELSGAKFDAPVRSPEILQIFTIAGTLTGGAKRGEIKPGAP